MIGNSYLKKIRDLSLSYFLTDKHYAEKRYKSTFGQDLNLKNPVTFNEKIQWLKLYDRNERYIPLADKYEVRKYVEENAGPDILNELYGVFSDVEDIHLDDLPDSFVLKATHGSGWNILCRDKNTLDWDKEKKKLDAWLKLSYYKIGREWVYKKIEPRIICEKYLEPKTDDQLYDYKFFCFNGLVKYIQVDINRYSNHTRCYYDIHWNKQPFSTNYPIYKKEIDIPKNLDKMISVSEKLSSGIPFVRIDLYSIDAHIVFGEMTFYPGNGFGKFNPPEFDYNLGKNIDILLKS
jgi:hypothetical protein